MIAIGELANGTSGPCVFKLGDVGHGCALPLFTLGSAEAIIMIIDIYIYIYAINPQRVCTEDEDKCAKVRNDGANNAKVLEKSVQKDII